MNIKSFLILLLFFVSTGIMTAQFAEPALGGADYDGDPIQAGYAASLTFNWVNSGASTMPADAAEIIVSFPNKYYMTDGTTPPTGTIANWFDWMHTNVEGGDTWVGTLNKAVPAFDGGTIVFEVVGITTTTEPEATTIFTQPTGKFDKFLNAPGNDNLAPKAEVLTVLPVELTSFKATLEDCKARLIWTTATETGVSHFEVEQSANGTAFAMLVRVDATGSVVQSASYNFTDTQLTQNNYYRLKIVDMDGSVEYSEIFTVYADCASVVSVSEVFPNPVKNELVFIRLNSSLNHEDAQILVMDILGETLMSMPVVISEGSNLFSIDPNRLAAAPYMIVVEGNDWRTSVSKFVKVSE